MPARSSTGGRAASRSGCTSSPPGASVSSRSGFFGKTTSGSIPTQFVLSPTSPSGSHPTCPRRPRAAARNASSAVSKGKLPTRRTSLRAVPVDLLISFLQLLRQRSKHDNLVLSFPFAARGSRPLAEPPKRHWLGSRKTDVPAHRQSTCAITGHRLCLRRLKGSTTPAHPRRVTRTQCAGPLQPDEIRGRRDARASAQEAAGRGQQVWDRADRVHHRTAGDRTPGGRVQGARRHGARSAERSGHLPPERYRGFYRSAPPSGGQVREPSRRRASPPPPRCAKGGG